jgi:hypothetical protein
LSKKNLKNLKVISSILSTLNLGIGDLTWESNLGNQKLENITDNYYFDDEQALKYCISYIKQYPNVKLLKLKNNEYLDFTQDNLNKLLDWNLISSYIIYKKNIESNNKLKIVIFYDSFLTQGLHLYMDIFYEIYFIKDIFKPEHIYNLQPDYFFEFRIERFLM